MPVPSKKGNPYNLPQPSSLRKPEVVERVLTRFIETDALSERFYNDALRTNIAARYEYALLLFEDAKAYAAFAREPRVVALARKLKDAEDVCRAVIMSSVADPSKGSKIWKRVEHLWQEKKPSSEVVRLLKRYGLEKPIPGVTAPRHRPSVDVEGDDEEIDSGSVRPASKPPRTRPLIIEEDPTAQLQEGPSAVIHNAPPHYGASVGAQVTFGGTVLAVNDGEITIAVSAFRLTPGSKG